MEAKHLQNFLNNPRTCMNCHSSCLFLKLQQQQKPVPLLNCTISAYYEIGSKEYFYLKIYQEKVFFFTDVKNFTNVCALTSMFWNSNT